MYRKIIIIKKKTKFEHHFEATLTINRGFPLNLSRETSFPLMSCSKRKTIYNIIVMF